jgi:hypothetical protein
MSTYWHGYEDAFHIELEFEDRADFALGYLYGFDEVEVIDGGDFKDRVCLTTICRRSEDDSYWSFQWSECSNGVDTSSNDYNMDSYIHRVQKIEVTTMKTCVDWVRPRE